LLRTRVYLQLLNIYFIMALENSLIRTFSVEGFKSGQDGEDAAAILASMPNFIMLNPNPISKLNGQNFLESVRTPSSRPSSSQRKRPNKPMKFYTASILSEDTPSFHASSPVMKRGSTSKVRTELRNKKPNLKGLLQRRPSILQRGWNSFEAFKEKEKVESVHRTQKKASKMPGLLHGQNTS
jgi:hypothetical protein